MAALSGLLDEFFVPIRKADDELLGIEIKMGDIMAKHWGKTTADAVQKASASLPAGQIGEKDVKLMLEVLANELGPEFAQKTPNEIGDLVKAAYAIGKTSVAKDLKVETSLSLEDQKAQGVLAGHHMFWIREHYDTALGKDIADIVNQVALKDGLGRDEVGKALKAKFGSTFNETDNYWRLLGAASVQRARNMGGVGMLIEAEVDEYEILPVMDERTSNICRAMNGKVFKVEHAVKQRDYILDVGSPEEMKDAFPWHSARMGDDGSWQIKANGSKDWVPLDALSQKGMADRGLALPPYHAFCRTTYVIKTFKESYSTSSDPMPISWQPVKKGQGMPAADDLTFSKDGKFLGGAGAKSIYTDADGQEYIFKPATSKSGVPEAFRAYVQEAAAKIQAIAYDGEQFIDVKAMTLGGKFGTLQPKLDVLADLKGEQSSLEKLNSSTLEMIQGEHVIDWLISNHDGHGGNIILTKQGKLYGIDKEQAFRYFPGDKLDWNYHPNAAYGEQEPIYNTLMRKWSKGELDLNANHVLPQIQRIEKIADADYRSILEPYAASRWPKDAAARAKFLDDAVARKNNLRKDFEGLYSKALTAKLGKPYKFQFADTMPAKDFLEAPIAVQTFSVADLEKMSKGAIEALAKAQKLSYYSHMTKEEIIECLARPEKADEIAAFAKERKRARSKSSGDGDPKKPAAVKPEPGVDPFDDFDVVKPTEFGSSFQKDSVIVEGQHVNIRKVFNGIGDEYQITFKLLQDNIADVEAAMRKLDPNAVISRTDNISGGGYDKDGKFVQVSGVSTDIKSRNIKIADGQLKMQLYNDYNAKAYRGRVVIRALYPSGQKAASKTKELLQKLGIEAVAKDTTEADEKLLKLSRLFVQYEPELAGSMTAADRTIENISEALKMEGLDPKRVDSWTKEEVWKGYFTFLDQAGLEEMEKLGADHLFAGSRSVEGVVGSIKNGGMMSTTERYRNGIFHNGASSGADIGTGGAEQVFTRLVTKNQLGKHDYSDSYSGGPYVFKINRRILARTDWYAFEGDEFGKSEDYATRKSRPDIVKTLMRSWKSGNELMFRHGIRISEIDEIRCQSESHRSKLLDALRKEGISQVNGTPIEQYVTTEARIKP